MKYITMGIKEVDVNKFKKIENHFAKPRFGLWSCPYLEDSDFVSDWMDWCHIEMPHWIKKDCVVFELKKDANILVIDSYIKAKQIRSTYGYTLEDLSPMYGINMAYIDYEKISTIYDGIFVSKRAIREACYDIDMFLYGWDVESLCLFNLNCIDTWSYEEVNITD